MEKGFTITYEYGDNLYVNPTNRCNFNCEFCLRHNQAPAAASIPTICGSKREPSKEETLASIREPRPHQVPGSWCSVGFGEPTYRMDDICWVIDQMKARGEQDLHPHGHQRHRHTSSTAGISRRTLPAGSTWCPSP